MKKRRLVQILVVLLLAALSLEFLVDPRPSKALSQVGSLLKPASPRIVIDRLSMLDYMTTGYYRMRYDTQRKIFTFDDYIASVREEGDRFEQAVAIYHTGAFQEAVDLLTAFHNEEGPGEESLFWQAICHIRLTENQNCLRAALQTGQPSGCDTPLCTLPIKTLHERDSDVKKAAAILQRLLDEHDGSNLRYRWLLNFCYMAMGDFPHGVPDRYLIDTPFTDRFYGRTYEELSRRHENLQLRERGRELGVSCYTAGKGVAVEDFNGDGALDIVVGGLYTPLALYENHGEDGFVEKAAAVGLEDLFGTHLITAADYDNDGWMDLFIGKPWGAEWGGFHLYRNLEGKGFQDVSEASGLRSPQSRELRCNPWTSAWGDVDNDGDLDLFVANMSEPALAVYDTSFSTEDSKLFLNEGGQFRDATEAFGLGEVVKHNALVGAAFGDVDDDGDADLLLTSLYPGFHNLFLNHEGTRFEQDSRIQTPLDMGFMASFVDIDHDGRLDVFMGVNGAADHAIHQTVFGKERDGCGHSLLFHQQSDGSFLDRSDFFRDRAVMASMGVNFGDINNDGAYDFYFGTGNPEPWYILPNLFYLGETEDGHPTGYMENITSILNVGTIRKGHGIVFFDYDDDGDQDIYSSLGGAWPSDPWFNELFENESRVSNSWIKIRLKGTRSNSFGVGAKIKVVARNAEGEKRVRHYHMDNQTGFGSAPYLSHIGLFDSTLIEKVEVRWPGELNPVAYPATINFRNTLVQE